MNRFCQNSFPGSAFTGDQDCAVGVADLSDKIEDVLHFRTMSDDVFELKLTFY